MGWIDADATKWSEKGLLYSSSGSRSAWSCEVAGTMLGSKNLDKGTEEHGLEMSFGANII